jgi:hypothetical protein
MSNSKADQHFPFGSKLTKVEQKSKTSKKVFVLGVYASAVHAKWIGSNGKTIVRALAVASEPYIFWRGDDVHKIIDEIKIPKEAGTLIPADASLNGPSGITLDECFLKPFGLTREDAWLCDLLPYSRVNPSQRKAIDKHYTPLVNKFDLPEASIWDFDKKELKAPARKDEILAELMESGARNIILLGDLPIEHFLDHVIAQPFKRLGNIVKGADEYGKPIIVEIANRKFSLFPMVHPRQAGNLGKSSKYWNETHSSWMQRNKIKL